VIAAVLRLSDAATEILTIACVPVVVPIALGVAPHRLLDRRHLILHRR
jgi:hypothetical protein